MILGSGDFIFISLCPDIVESYPWVAICVGAAVYLEILLDDIREKVEVCRGAVREMNGVGFLLSIPDGLTALTCSLAN